MSDNTEKRCLHLLQQELQEVRPVQHSLPHRGKPFSVSGLWTRVCAEKQCQEAHGGPKVLAQRQPLPARSIANSFRLDAVLEFKVIEIKEKFQVTVEKVLRLSVLSGEVSKHTEYKIHLKDHHEEKSAIAVLSKIAGDGLTTLRSLWSTHFHTNMSYGCHVCPDRFTDLNDLNLHQYTHLTDQDTREKQVFKCKLCKTTHHGRRSTLSPGNRFTPTLVLSAAKIFTAKRYLKNTRILTQRNGSCRDFCSKCS